MPPSTRPLWRPCVHRSHEQQNLGDNRNDAQRFGPWLAAVAHTLRVVTHNPAIAAALALLCTTVSVVAHPGFIGTVHATLDSERHLRIIVKHDALAFALNDTSHRIADEPMLQLLRSSDDDLSIALHDGTERFHEQFEIRTPDGPVTWTLVEQPTVQAVREWQILRPTLPIPIKLHFEAQATLPAHTTCFAFRLPEVLGDAITTVHRPGYEPYATPIPAGEWTDCFPLQAAPETNTQQTATPLPSEVSAAPGLNAQLSTSDQTSAAAINTATVPNTETTHSENSPATPDSPSFLRTIACFAVLGFEHIIPKGVDHVLFVLGLFLVSPSIRSLLWQVTAFTVAHSVTLVLASLGMVNIPGNIVEPIIAASIALVAIEAIFAGRTTTAQRESNINKAEANSSARRSSSRDLFRLAVVFIFGLVHGLGFAGVLSELGLPTRQFIPALFAFNIGIEIGQFAVIAIAMALVGWARHRPLYRPVIVIPAALVIACIGLWWTFERVTGA